MRKFSGSYPYFKIKSLNSRGVWASRLLWPCNYFVSEQRRQRSFLHGCLSSSDKSQLTEVFFSKGSPKTEFGHPIEKYFRNAAEKNHICCQFEPLICVLIILKAMLHLTFGTCLAVHQSLPFLFTILLQKISLISCSQWLMLWEKEMKTFYW